MSSERNEGTMTVDRHEDLDLNVIGLNVEDDDEAREAADVVYFALQNAGYEVDGVSPVLREV